MMKMIETIGKEAQKLYTSIIIDVPLTCMKHGMIEPVPKILHGKLQRLASDF